MYWLNVYLFLFCVLVFDFLFIWKSIIHLAFCIHLGSCLSYIWYTSYPKCKPVVLSVQIFTDRYIRFVYIHAIGEMIPITYITFDIPFIVFGKCVYFPILWFVPFYFKVNYAHRFLYAFKFYFRHNKRLSVEHLIILSLFSDLF